MPFRPGLARALSMLPLPCVFGACAAACAGERLTLSDPPPSGELRFSDFDPEPSLNQPGKKKFVHNRDSDPSRPPVIGLIDSRYEITTRTDFDTSDGSIDIRRSAVSGNLVIGPEYDLQISVPVDYEVSHYQFHGHTGLTPDGRYPILDGTQIFMAPNVEVKIDEEYGIFAGGLILLAGQHDLSEPSGNYGGFAGVRYTIKDKLVLRAGLSGIDQLEDEPLILPAIQFEWRIDERTRLAAEGPELRFEYDLDEAWTVKVAGAWESRTYRLDENAPVPNALFQEQRLPVTLRLEYVPHPALRFEIWGGVQAYQHYQTKDPNGVKYRDERADPAAVLGASFEVIF